MNDGSGDPLKGISPEPIGVLEIRDLPDFALRWPSIRHIGERFKSRPNLSSSERELLHWLIELADRVCCDDIENDD